MVKGEFMSIRKNKEKKKRKKSIYKYVNGMRGMVSLFLVLVISPLLSLALILVESARYQHALESIQEIVDSSAFSTLAEYDVYLDERFGLLTTSQENEIDAVFKDYMEKNKNVLGKSVTIDSKEAKGAYALTNTDVLKQQLLEYSEISVAAEIVTEGINLDELLEELDESLGISELNDEIKAIESGIDLTAEIEKLIEAVTEAKEQYPKYSSALDEYKTAYSDFEENATNVIDLLKTAEENLGEEEDPNSVYDDKDVKKAIEDLKKSRKIYKEKVENLKTELSILKEEIDKIFSALDKIPSKLEKFDSETAESSLASECTTSTYEWLKIIFDQVTTTMDTAVGKNYRDNVNSEIKQLEEQIIKLGNLDTYTIKTTWTDETIQKEYGPVKITTIKNSFTTKMNTLLDALNNKAKIEEKEKKRLNSLLDIASELLGVTGLYDASLNSKINSGLLYVNTNVSVSSQLAMDSLTDLLDAGDEFVGAMSSGNILKALKAVGKLLSAIVKFLGAIVTWIAETLVQLINYIASGPKEWYNGLLLYGYGAYNMPNRTNYPNGSSVSNYSYKNIFNQAGGKEEKAITKSLNELSTIGIQTGTDRLFKGAEAEYLLVGSTSEIYNQSSTFFNLYLLRLALDIIPILKNPQVSTMAAAAGPGAWVVKMAIILAEPMLDSIILVNGGNVYLFKETVYMSYSGFVILQEDLVNCTSISKNLQDKIGDAIEAHNGKPAYKGSCKVSYTEHLLLLLLLSVNEVTYMQRMQNLIQLEAREYYKDECEFDLDKTYTYIDSEVKYTLNPMFKVDYLTDNGLFTATSKQYLGY